MAGGRGAKDQAKDVAEAADALARWQEMRAEEVGAAKPATEIDESAPEALAQKEVLRTYPQARISQIGANEFAVVVIKSIIGVGKSPYFAWADAAQRLQDKGSKA